MRRMLIAFALLCGSVAAPAFAEEKGPVPAMREVGPGIFEIGKLRLNKNERSVSFPGRLNMDQDFVEYVLVTKDGSTHESLLVTDIQPTDLHFAMLLLGAKGAGLTTPSADQAPPARIDAEYLQRAPKLNGDNVLVTATWKTEKGMEQTAPVEAWLFNTKTKTVAARGPWIYTASMFGSDGGFLAQQQGVFISVINNPSALIN